MAVKTIESRITLDASPDEVWSVLFDFGNYPEWNPFLPRMEASLAEGETFKAMSRLPSGLKLSFVGRITSVVPHTSVVWEGRPTLMPAKAMHVRHTFTLLPMEGGTQLHQLEEATGFIISVSGWILGQAQKGQVALNEALAKQLARAG